MYLHLIIPEFASPALTCTASYHNLKCQGLVEIRGISPVARDNQICGEGCLVKDDLVRSSLRSEVSSMIFTWETELITQLVGHPAQIVGNVRSVSMLQFPHSHHQGAGRGTVTVITSSWDEKLKFVKEKFGVDHVISYHATPNRADEVRRLTNGEGTDYVLEIGGAGTIE